jgi:CBS domain-containing protein
MTWSMVDRIDGLGLRSPVVVSGDESLRSVARMLWREDVGAVVVCDGRRPVGILSERDLVEHVAHGKDLDAVTAREAMTSHMIAAKSNDTVHDAAYQMLECGIRHVPVLSDTDELIGMVSIRDLLRPVLSDVGR